MNTIQQFVQHNGVKAIVRRHFDYNTLVPSFGEGMSNLAPSLNYTHSLEESRIGLTPAACQQAFEQARQMAEWGIVPGFIVCGENQRNWDGARFSAAGIQSVTGNPVGYQSSPGVSYPRYIDATRLKNLLDTYGDAAVNMSLKGDERTTGIWTETPTNFANRVKDAILADYPWGITLFDLNFEALVAAYYLLVERRPLAELPIDPKTIWTPTKGGGIIIGTNGNCMMYAPDLSILSSPFPYDYAPNDGRHP